MKNETEDYELGDVVLQSGKTLNNAKLAYATWGELNPARDNVIVLPTYYTGTHESYEPIIAPGRALDPTRYFIVSPNLFGNGLSTSPSNATGDSAGGNFPDVTAYDNVRCQHRMLVDLFDVQSVALVAGWSMGAMQAFHWGADFPEMVRAIAPWAGSARCSNHNTAFLEGVKAALTADPAWNNGHYPVQPERGLRAFGRAYCGWAFSQTWFREELWSEFGHESLEAMLDAWEEEHLEWDANDLLAKLHTWQLGDIAEHTLHGGDFEAALGAIKAKAIVMPSRTDMYFPPEDSEIEVSHMPNAQLRVIESIWGHCAGGPGRETASTAFIESALSELLA